MNEVIVTAESNIGDYIWYIVGGVSFFFVLVGFIADKTGLIKKTFSKEINKIDRKPVEESSENLIEENTVVNNNDNDNVTEEINIVDDVVESPVTGDFSTSVMLPIEEQPVIINNQEDEFLMDIDSLNEQANENLVSEEKEEVTFDESIGNNEDFMIDNDSNISDDILIDSTEENSILNEENDEQSSLEEQNDVWNMEESEFAVEQEGESEVGEQQENDESGVELQEENEQINLPSIEEVEEGEEDVWKF